MTQQNNSRNWNDVKKGNTVVLQDTSGNWKFVEVTGVKFSEYNTNNVTSVKIRDSRKWFRVNGANEKAFQNTGSRYSIRSAARSCLIPWLVSSQELSDWNAANDKATADAAAKAEKVAEIKKNAADAQFVETTNFVQMLKQTIVPTAVSKINIFDDAENGITYTVICSKFDPEGAIDWANMESQPEATYSVTCVDPEDKWSPVRERTVYVKGSNAKDPAAAVVNYIIEGS